MEKNNMIEAGEISIKDLIGKLKNILTFLFSKWIQIFLIGLIGTSVGLIYTFFQPIKYISKISFVVEDSKSSMGGLASIAGQFGFDLGGSSGGGVFSGDNILLFLKSESLCRQTLFTPYDQEGKVLLVDKYAEVSKLKRDWLKDDEIGEINFANYKTKLLPRVADSLLQEIIKDILEKDFSVSKPDKKASFVEVKALMRDEKLSQLFTTRIVKIATDRYIESKTKVKAANVAQLQRRADSLSALLNNKTFGAAERQQSLVDVNPALRTAPIAAEISTRDKTMIATIFGEVVKNLEFAKFALNQETPVIQLVDQTSFPLVQEKTTKLRASILGGILASVLFIFYLSLVKWYRKMMSN